MFLDVITAGERPVIRIGCFGPVIGRRRHLLPSTPNAAADDVTSHDDPFHLPLLRQTADCSVLPSTPPRSSWVVIGARAGRINYCRRVLNFFPTNPPPRSSSLVSSLFYLLLFLPNVRRIRQRAPSAAFIRSTFTFRAADAYPYKPTRRSTFDAFPPGSCERRSKKLGKKMSDSSQQYVSEHFGPLKFRSFSHASAW